MTPELLAQNNLISAPIGEGDAGIIIKPDLSFQLFNTHATIDPEMMTETQHAQGEMLIGLSVALKFPAVMVMLIQMSNDPDLCSQDALVAAPPKLHS